MKKSPSGLEVIIPSKGQTGKEKKGLFTRIETVDRLYNNAISMVFDKDTLYLGVAEEA